MSLWGSTVADPELAARRDKSSRIPDLAYGIAIVMGGVPLGGFPFVDLATVVMLGFAFLRRSRYHLPLGTLIILCGLWLGLAISGEVNGLEFNFRRLGHVGIWAAMTIAVGQGRINLMSMARGVGIGILVALPLSLPSIASGNYAGRLTGLFGDPNTAGMILVTMGPWAVGIVRSRFRWPVGIAVAVAIVLTFSRTSLLAFALVLAWVVLSKRFNVWVSAIVLTLVAVFTADRIEALRLAGPFEVRSGSDELRDRIAQSAAEKLAITPWYGNGPGTATVKVADLTFYLHNSYDGLRIEGGWVALAFVTAIIVIAFTRAATGSQAQRHRWFEAGLAGGLVCALSLGEVLLEPQMAVNLGALLLVGSIQRSMTIDNDHLDRRFGAKALRLAPAPITDDAFIARLADAGVVATPQPDDAASIFDRAAAGAGRPPAKT